MYCSRREYVATWGVSPALPSIRLPFHTFYGVDNLCHKELSAQRKSTARIILFSEEHEPQKSLEQSLTNITAVVAAGSSSRPRLYHRLAII